MDSGLQDGGATEGMADQDFRRRVMLFKKAHGSEQIADVRREVRVGEVALALAETGEVEAQHGEAGIGQGSRYVTGGLQVLGTREAVREQGIRPRCVLGKRHQPR